jgi:WD40 repeat protein
MYLSTIDVVNCLQVNGSRLVTGSRDKTIRQWDLSKLISHPESVTNLSELSFASASIHELSNVGDNCWIASLEGHSGSVTCLHFENSSLVSLAKFFFFLYVERLTHTYILFCSLNMKGIWILR